MQPLPMVGVKTERLIDSLDLLSRTLNISAETGLRMSGDTVLAMLWQHRHSTDIDLSMPGEPLQEAVSRGYDQISDVLHMMRKRGEISRVRIRVGGMVSWRWGDRCEVSVSTAWGKRNEPTHQEQESALPLSPVKDILLGKLRGRVIQNKRLLVRDGYDLCVASKKDPRTFFKLVDELLREEADALHATLKTIRATNHRIVMGRALLNPTDQSLAKDPWGDFANILDQYIEAKSRGGEDIDL